jgi:lipopolysaccharide assembly outer membrane protein LptD (OstA)
MIPRGCLNRSYRESSSAVPIFFIIGLIGLITPSIMSAQEPFTPLADSTLAGAASDTADTLKTLTPPKSSTVEGPVKYWAENILFSLPSQTTHMEGNAKIVYQSITLTAGKIDIDWSKNYLVAEGVADSTDSLGNQVYRDLPVLTEKGEEPIKGFRLEYDFTNNRGKVLEGQTDMEPGHYRGENIRKVGKETLFIQDGYFTTCDLEDDPHFFFRSDKMRIRLKKEVVAKPIIMYIADVPIFALPFAVFSLKRGRRSGIIIPKFGQTDFGGRYLQDFGYYWAPSDYWDLTMLATFYEKTSIVYTGNFQYKKRYVFNGRVNGSYSPKDVRTGQKRERWQLNFDHFHKIAPTLTLSGNGSFVSDKQFLQDYYSDFDTRTNQTLRTNVSLKKTLPGSRTLSINLRREENLQTERLDFDFPDVSYRQPSMPLIPSKSSKKSWYHDIRYSYNSSLRSSGSRIPITDSQTGETSGFNTTSATGWGHDITPTFSAKFLKYLNLTPSMSFQELWVAEYLDYRLIDSTNTVAADTIKGFRARHLLNNIGLNARTTLYGLFDIPFSPLKVIRHKIDPAIGFRFQPDYSDDVFGYYQTLRDTSGKEIKQDHFANNVFRSGTPRGKVRSLTFNVNNLFQGKLLRKEEEKKIDLFRVDFSTAYNFALDSLRWSDLRTTFQSKPHNRLNISLNARHSFYKKNATGGRFNEYVWSDGFKLPDLIDWSLNINYGLSLRPPGDKKEEAPLDTLAQLSSDELDLLTDQTDILKNRDFRNFEGLQIPWSVDLNFTYSYSDNGDRVTQRFDANLTARLKITKNWNISYRSRYDIKNWEIVDQRFRIDRDLHCWQMSFDWSPNPNFRYYRMEIRVKEQILRDLKLTKSANRTPF